MQKENPEKEKPFFKKIIASLGYHLINKLSDVHIPKDAGDL